MFGDEQVEETVGEGIRSVEVAFVNVQGVGEAERGNNGAGLWKVQVPQVADENCYGQSATN